MPLVLVALAVVLLLVLMTKFKLNGFISLFIVALLVGIASGMSLSDVYESMVEGVGGQLGELILTLGFGAMLGKVLADSGAAQRIATTMVNFFGISLAFDGTTLMVGATESGGGPGSVYVFTNDGTSWVQQQRLTVDGINSGANFGNAIALHDGGALIGADIQTVDGFTSRGAAYLFDFDGTGWSLGHTFVSSDGTTDDFFGVAIGYDGTTALISTLHPNGNQGAAYFYTHDTIFSDGFDG